MTKAENTDLLSSWILSLSERPEAYKRFEGMIKFNLENNILDDEVFDLKRLSEKLGVDVPVSRAIYDAVYTDITPQETLSKLMNRKLKEEENYD